MSITIFSQPIHSGKTTKLLHWCDQQKNAAGILMPDIDGKRKILDLETKEVFAIECDNPANTKEELITVGKYHFYAAVFEKANSLLLAALSRNPQWLVIDEVGKLELGGKGFYPAVKKITDDQEEKITTTNILLVVRDSLCAEVINFFKINKHIIIHRLEDL